MKLIIGKQQPRVISSFAEASGIYRDLLERSSVGGSRAPEARILDEAGNQTHYVSYNGRVWEGTSRDWISGQMPVYRPDAEF